MFDVSTDGERRRSQRREKRRYRFHDRRSGFDRRASETSDRTLDRMLLGLDGSSFALVAVLVATNFLNVADLAFTVHLMGQGATEANPVMLSLFGLAPLTAGVVKIAALALVTIGFWRLRRYRTVLALSVLTLAGFSLLVGYELLLTAAAV